MPSFVSNLLDSAGGTMSEKDTFTAKWTAVSIYLGGADTVSVSPLQNVRFMHCLHICEPQSASALATFFLAMTWHPEIQERACEEIARVVGSDRLPDIRDRPSLPYIEAIAKESLRWHPFVPEGVPHLMTAEASLAGYRIPKGAIVIANAW